MMEWENKLNCVILILLAPAFICAVLFLAGLPFYLGWQYFHPPTTIELNLSDWECVSTYTVRKFNGKIWYTETLCADYRRPNE